jgi:hypothetical protein
MTVDVDNAPHEFIQYVKMAGRPSDNEGKCTECDLYEDEGPHVDDHNTIVVFRVDPGPRGDVFALMPEDPADEHGILCGSYQHIGQHAAANYAHCIATSRPATPAEYADLLGELTRIGYRVVVRQRASHAMVQRRKAEARA